MSTIYILTDPLCLSIVAFWAVFHLWGDKILNFIFSRVWLDFAKEVYDWFTKPLVFTGIVSVLVAHAVHHMDKAAGVQVHGFDLQIQFIGIAAWTLFVAHYLLGLFLFVAKVRTKGKGGVTPSQVGEEFLRAMIPSRRLLTVAIIGSMAGIAMMFVGTSISELALWYIILFWMLGLFTPHLIRLVRWLYMKSLGKLLHQLDMANMRAEKEEKRQKKLRERAERRELNMTLKAHSRC